MILLRYVYYPVALALAVLVVVDADEADRMMRLAAQMQSLSGTTRMAWVSLLERLSFSWYSGATELAGAYAQIVEQARAAEWRAVRASAAIAALGIAHLVFVFVSSQRNAFTLAWHLNLLAVIIFAVGICAPMLTVIAHSDVPVLGDVVLRYETKSILSTIAGLIATSHWPLAAAIAMFSIVVPVGKVVLVFFALWPGAAVLRARALVVLHNVGKWSMADVFVVAVLVAFLALNKDAFSNAEIGLGLYFFSAYCGLSMIAAQLAAKSPGQEI